MKRQIQMPNYARKTYPLILIISAFFILIIGFLGVSLLDTQYSRELQSLSNITGTVIAEYPDAEKALLSAAQDINGSHLNEGFAILEKYGYRNNLLMTNNPYYRSLLGKFFSFLSLISLLYFILVTLCFFRLSRDQQAQEAQLHALFDHYLSENYTHVTDQEAFMPIFNDSFTDTLINMSVLRSKTRESVSPRQNTIKSLNASIVEATLL